MTEYILSFVRKRLRVVAVFYGVIGDVGYREKYSSAGLRVLRDSLVPTYGMQHLVAVYEASRYPICDPVIQWVPLGRLLESKSSPISTLYVPPRSPREPDMAMIERLQIPKSYILRKAHSMQSVEEVLDQRTRQVVPNGAAELGAKIR